MYRSVKQINAAFRAFCRENRIPLHRGRPQNSQPCDTRAAYVDFVNSLACDGVISETLANKATYF